MSRVLVIPDIHEPATRRHAIKFCKDVQKKWKCNRVMFLGDIADWHAISFHSKHPELPGPKDEYKLAKMKIKQWHKAFPKAEVCIGNHDERLLRLAESVNIPARFLKNFNEIWETPGWNWDYNHEIDGVYYFHGVGSGGDYPAFNAMKKKCQSVVMGHIHHAAGVNWLANNNTRLFGMACGCLIDDALMNFAYAKHTLKRSMLGCGVVIDGIPYLEVMPCAKGEKYHDKK